MGKKDTVPTDLWRHYLREKGLSFARTKGDHEMWKKPGLPRPIVFRTGKKEIPWFHISGCLRTLGVTREEFEQWLQNT